MEKYYVAFSCCECIGPRTFKKLMTQFDNPKDAYHANPEILSLIIGRQRTNKFLEFRSSFRADSMLLEMDKQCIQLLIPNLSEWHNIFAYIFDNPICLYAKGDISLLQSVNTIAIGIIGTRKPSPYGKYVTEQLVRDLTRHNITIISGLALGIDSIAHRECLQNGGKTIAILGSGIDIPYPSHHHALYQEIIDSGGLLLSEYPPGTPPYPSNFVQRNRLISGLSKGLVVIEGAEKSGTLITADFAIEQGKEVFAVPGSITSPMSFAPHHLIQNSGVHLITSAQDILDHYRINGLLEQSNALSSGNSTYSNLAEQERALIVTLSQHPQTANALFEGHQESFAGLLSTLTQLEIKGYITREDDGKYYISSNPTPSIPP